MALNVLEAIIGRLTPRQSAQSSELVDFDPVFYRQYYGDLHHLDSPRKLSRHYLAHGMREGRRKNLAEARAIFTANFGELPTDFTVRAYRELNEDLARAFDHEWQFEFHYLEHGRKEGRRYKFSDDPSASQSDRWKDLFRLADFVACAHSWLADIPQTKERGVALFIEAGIDRLAPINLNLVFDPGFYRSAYGFPESMADAELYRHWLETGFVEGLSPNEEKALQDIVANRRYPSAFDWESYKSALPRSEAEALRHRVDVLRHLFDAGFERGRVDHIAGEGADELFAAIGDYNLIRGRHRQAIAAYDYAINLNPSPSRTRHHRADAYVALGKTVAAQADFAKVAADANATVWSTTHAAKLAAGVGSFEKSFEILGNGHERWRKISTYRDTISEVVEQYFSAKSRSVMALYDAGDRNLADAYMLKALDEIRAQITKLGDLPSKMGPNPRGHIAVLANQDLVQCKHYRVEQKLRQLRRAGLETEIFDQNDTAPFMRSLLGARAAIFYRVPAFPNILRAILTAKALGIPTFYEIDDLIFDAAHYPDTFETYEGQISKAEYHGLLYGVPLFRYAMGLCDYGLASTPPLADQMAPVVKKGACFVLRNGLDERNEKTINMGRTPRPERGVVTIFYGSGTKAHNSDFNELAAPALLYALEHYDNVRLVLIGHLRLRSEFDCFSSRIKQLEFVSDLHQYWSLLAASDINIAILSPGLMTDCKSEIKWLEAAVLQIPSVVSATSTYLGALKDGVDALIVENDSSAWKKALTRLIESADLRRSIGAAARRKALESYSLDAAAASLQQILKPPIPAADSRLTIKVLVCAVFFPPQSYGGATRVVQDNVDYLIDQCPDVEVSAFTTDEGVAPCGRFRFDQYRGVPVFRLSTPIEENMDWRPFNPENEPHFERVLDAVKPDLIHFHCIQRLTASTVEVALKREIPYIVTVHDGWWISDHQFLVDQDGVLRLPSENPYDVSPPPGMSPVESITRRQRLQSLLEGAERVISVSESFADIYRRAGCGNVISIPNGVSQIKPAQRRTSSDGRLSLGHIGGRSAHKGAMLIEAVLRMNNFENLKLTMIDFSMQPGTRSERIWGNTPVTLCGAYAQDQVAELYASLDVLLAPSIWPESFGLVAREARSQGLWVVASDRGAVSEGVIPGENGFIIDVSDARGLTKVLHMLGADVARYQNAPPQSNEPVRTAADQGQEIAALYRDIVSKQRAASGGSNNTTFKTSTGRGE